MDGHTDLYPSALLISLTNRSGNLLLKSDSVKIEFCNIEFLLMHVIIVIYQTQSFCYYNFKHLIIMKLHNQPW